MATDFIALKFEPKYANFVTMENDSDAQLIQKYLRGNEEALEILIKRYLPQIFGFVKKFTGNQNDASDITQEVFVKVWKNLKKFDSDKSFKSWIFTIAKRTAIDLLRKKNALPFSRLEKENENGEKASFAESLADESAELLGQLIKKENNQKLAFAIGQLPEHYNSVIQLRVDQDLTFLEISRILKRPLNTIKGQYRRGILLLKKILA